MKSRKTITKKTFREILNKRYGLVTSGQGLRGKYKATKRLYGDYLYTRDPAMFNYYYEEYKKN